MQNTLVEKLEHLLEILYGEFPEDNLIVFDKHDNGYCIDEIRIVDNVVSLISHQEVLDKIDNHICVKDILAMLKGIDPDFIVEVLISISGEHNEFLKEFNSELYLQI